MTDWRERSIEASARRQLANDEATRRTVQNAIREKEERDRGFIAIGEARLKEFDPLNIPQKLADIKREWGSGTLDITKGGDLYGDFSISHTLTHIHTFPRYKFEPITRTRFGPYTEVYETMSVGGHDVHTEEKFGFHKEEIGRRLVAIDFVSEGVSLCVVVSTRPTSDTFSVEIDPPATLNISAFRHLKTGWEIRQSLGFRGSVAISFREANKDIGLLEEVVDDLLLQSSTSMSVLIRNWDEVRARAKEDARSLPKEFRD